MNAQYRNHFLSTSYSGACDECAREAQKAGRLPGYIQHPVHVVNTEKLDKYGSVTITPTLHCRSHCPICSRQPKILPIRIVA